MNACDSCQIRLHGKTTKLAPALASITGYTSQDTRDARSRLTPAVEAADMEASAAPSSQEASCRLAYVYIVGSQSSEEQTVADPDEHERTRSHEHASTSGQCNGVDGRDVALYAWSTVHGSSPQEHAAADGVQASRGAQGVQPAIYHHD